MKNNLIILFAFLCLIFPCFVFATESSSGEGTKKAEIYLKPEDMHPNGINMEIGTASFWLEVGARISGDSGEKIAYQWYESKDGNMDNIKEIEGATQPVFVPEQKIGTTYYCVGVITTSGDKSFVEYTKLLEATFTPKVIDNIWIVGVAVPHIGDKIKNEAKQYTDYDLNDYYGYEISSVDWSPNDTEFKEGEAYTVNIKIEYWDNVKFSDKLDVKVNNKSATIKKSSDGKSAVVSYTFDKLEKIKDDDKINSGEKSGAVTKDDNTNLNNEGSINISTIVLITVIIILIIFAVIVLIAHKNNK